MCCSVCCSVRACVVSVCVRMRVCVCARVCVCVRMCSVSMYAVLFITHLSHPLQVEEFKDVVDQEYFGWVAQYLVMKRVSIEPNFHSLYMNFLDALNEKQLFVVVLKETHRNIKVSIIAE